VRSRSACASDGGSTRQRWIQCRTPCGIKFDWGRYDPTFAHVHSNRELTRELDELGIEHEAEEYRGLPWDKYWTPDGGRMTEEVLPFFARRLDFN
jgi:hypothetical protein